ncbi:hypothetical protein [Singulisphaera sp. GP187]|uniref:hypothetical protein n=1 Tax=Singulisphaera sp. GP187 TaxID=1882752 RepID=UPI0009409DDB|nr:hypothetical protein [Singulisphaera sp. GP187]
MTTYCRTQFGWGQVSERDYPENVEGKIFFAPIPSEIDAKAKAGRVHHYLRVRGSKDARKIARGNPDFLKMIREGEPIPRDARHLELKVAVEYTQQFVDAPFGRIEIPDPSEPILGSHSVPIMGLSEANRFFVIANSWPNWGYHSLGDMPFAFFDRFMIESWAVDESKPDLKPGPGGITVNSWEVPNPLGDRLFGFEVYDPSQDERIAWSFIVQREGLLDIEEFFVKPQFRRCGFGVMLAGKILELAEVQNRRIRAWIPYVDASEANRAGLTAILEKLGLSVRRSGVRWAAYKAVSGNPVAFPLVRIPDPPADPPRPADEEVPLGSLRGLITKYEDPFSAALSPDEWEAILDSN